MSNLIWSLALAAVGILGIWLAGSRSWYGWALGVLAQLGWLTFGLISGQYGFIISAVAYGVVYGRNLLRWRAEKKAETPE